VIREHVEKLFLCHFRLPLLSRREVRTLTARYAIEVGQPQQAPSPRDQGQSPQPHVSPQNVFWPAPDQDLPGVDDPPFSGRLPPAPQHPDGDSPPNASGLNASESSSAAPSDTDAAPEQEVDLFFTQNEAARLAVAVGDWTDRAGRLISPRAIRAFLLKYQLARLLRQIAGQPVEGSRLIRELAEASFGPGPRHIRDRIEGEARHDISVIVDQLA
jgi:hypothetical protein